jgi:hypothetical protein
MSRWDDSAEPLRRASWRSSALVVLSLDATRELVDLLDLDAATLVAVQPEIRRVLEAFFATRPDDPSAIWPELRSDLLSALEPGAREVVGGFYDRTLRFVEDDRHAYSDWADVLLDSAKDERFWLGLGLGTHERLRAASWEARELTAVGARIDAALEARPLSPWDTRIAISRELPPLEDAIGIGDRIFLGCAEVLAWRRFWRQASTELGAQGLIDLRERAQALLATLPSGRLHGSLRDPLTLADPELTESPPRPGPFLSTSTSAAGADQPGGVLRWDDGIGRYRRSASLLRAMARLSSDAALKMAPSLSLDPALMVRVQPHLRAAWKASFDELVADPTRLSLVYRTEAVFAELEPTTRQTVLAFYDESVRFSDEEPLLLHYWGVLLTKMASDDTAWKNLLLPAGASERLRAASLAAFDETGLRALHEAAFATGLTSWDAVLARLRLIAPLVATGVTRLPWEPWTDEEVLDLWDSPRRGFAVCERGLLACAVTARRLTFFRVAAGELGVEGIRELAARARHYNERGRILIPSVELLCDPWSLAHPELAAPAPGSPPGMGP